MLLDFGRSNWLDKAAQQPEKVKQVLTKVRADFQAAAKEGGFVLWDKVFNQLQTPFGSTNWERNYINNYVQKNYEVNLVFCKFK